MQSEKVDQNNGVLAGPVVAEGALVEISKVFVCSPPKLCSLDICDFFLIGFVSLQNQPLQLLQINDSCFIETNPVRKNHKYLQYKHYRKLRDEHMVNLYSFNRALKASAEFASALQCRK